MAHRKHAEEQELPFVALMDTMTNVVGVLLIALVMLGLSIATAVRKILSELPDVTEAQLEEVKQKVDALTPIQIDPAQAKLDELEAKKKIVEVSKQLETVDLSVVKQKVPLMSAAEVQKQIDSQSKVRDAQRDLLNKLLEEVERCSTRRRFTSRSHRPTSACPIPGIILRRRSRRG
jgi:vacuolar-type H+-ATPase subunit I/STV1